MSDTVSVLHAYYSKYAINMLHRTCLFTHSCANMSFSNLETSQYYFVLKILNKAGSDIFIKCTDGVPKRGFAVKKGFIVVITKLTNSVTPVGFSASDIHGKAVLLNGKSQLTLTPSAQKKKQPMKITVQNLQSMHFIRLGYLIIS